MLFIGYGYLPNGVDHPLPTTFTTAVVTLYSWLHSLNGALQVEEALNCAVGVMLMEIFIRMLWPFIMSVIKWAGRIS